MFILSAVFRSEISSTEAINEEINVACFPLLFHPFRRKKNVYKSENRAMQVTKQLSTHNLYSNITLIRHNTAPPTHSATNVVTCVTAPVDTAHMETGDSQGLVWTVPVESQTVPKF